MKFSKQLQTFLEKRTRFCVSAYFESHGLTVYLRHTKRLLNSSMLEEVIDVANVVAHSPGQGCFTRFLDDLEASVPAVYVECIQEPRLIEFLLARGYQFMTGEPRCMFRRRTKIRE